MNGLPAALGGATDDLTLWRLDREVYAADWAAGEGAFRGGGRWNSRGRRAVYCSLDPATAILEVAVHKGFDVLDTDPHQLTKIHLHDTAGFKVIQASDIPNPNWLRPGVVSKGQQAFGDSFLASNGIIVIPSVVSTNSWNVILTAEAAAKQCRLISQDRFALDQRLASPA